MLSTMAPLMLLLMTSFRLTSSSPSASSSSSALAALLTLDLSQTLENYLSVNDAAGK
jgi:hypothetical protein